MKFRSAANYLKKVTYQLLSVGLILLFACGNSKAEKEMTKTNGTITAADVAKIEESPKATLEGDGITAEWTLTWETYDDNENHLLETEERKKGFANKYYYRFNADGSCLIHFQKLKGHYEIKTEGNKKKLYTYIDEGEGKGLEAQYEIISTSKEELVLLWEVTFWIFKRVNK